MWSWAGFTERRNRGQKFGIAGHYLAIDDGRLGRKVAEYVDQQRVAPTEATTAAAVELYVVTKLVDLDAKAVELDLVLPIVTGRHRLGALRMAGLDELEEHCPDGRSTMVEVRHQLPRLHDRCGAN
jgi:hypothetical protein